MSAPQVLGPFRNASFFDAVRAIKAADMCDRCGKTRALVNVAQRGFREEKADPRLHCDCPPVGDAPAGPAYVAPAAMHRVTPCDARDCRAPATHMVDNAAFRFHSFRCEAHTIAARGYSRRALAEAVSA
jgi:hypothetical protein